MSYLQEDLVEHIAVETAQYLTVAAGGSIPSSGTYFIYQWLDK